VSLTENEVVLKSGEKIPFAYLAIATGSWQPSPSKLKSIERDDACAELQQLQQSVEAAETIAVVGGGAVGVELAGDIASYYQKKDVTLIHSRDQLLPRFGRKLHDHVMDVFSQLGIRVILGQRPRLLHSLSDKKSGSLTFPDGRVKSYDLIVSSLRYQLSL
jgi:apoptosis-inducing factor 2